MPIKSVLIALLVAFGSSQAHAEEVKGCTEMSADSFTKSGSKALQIYLLTYQTQAALPEGDAVGKEYLEVMEDCERVLVDMIMSLGEQSPAQYVRSLNQIESIAGKLPKAKLALAELAFSLQSEWEARHLFNYYSVRDAATAKMNTASKFSFYANSAYAFATGIARTNGVGPLGSFRDALVLSQGLDAVYPEFPLWGKAHQEKLAIPPPPSAILSFAVPIEMDFMNAALELRKKDQELARAAGVVTINGVMYAQSEVVSLLEISPWLKKTTWVIAAGASIYAQYVATKHTEAELEKIREEALDADLAQVVDSIAIANRAHDNRNHFQLVSKLIKAALARIAYRDSDLLAVERKSPISGHGESEEQFRKDLKVVLDAKDFHVDPAVARYLARNAAWESITAEDTQLKETLLREEKTDNLSLALSFRDHRFSPSSDAFLLQVLAFLHEDGWKSDRLYWNRILGQMINRYSVFEDSMAKQALEVSP